MQKLLLLVRPTSVQVLTALGQISAASPTVCRIHVTSLDDGSSPDAVPKLGRRRKAYLPYSECIHEPRYWSIDFPATTAVGPTIEMAAEVCTSGLPAPVADISLYPLREQTSQSLKPLGSRSTVVCACLLVALSLERCNETRSAQANKLVTIISRPGNMPALHSIVY